MKKIVFAVLAALMAAICLAGCAGTPDTPNMPSTPSGHTHTYDNSLWTYDENSHWRPSTCEHFTIRGEEAAHKMSGGKCEVCGYSVVGMTAEEFRKDHAEQSAAFARLCAGIASDSVAAAKIASEFVWFDTDENNKLTALTYLYTAQSESEETNTVNVVKVSKLNKIDLKEIAAGKATLQYQSIERVSSSTYSYKTGETETYRQLAEAVCKVYEERYGAEVRTPLLRLPNVRKASDSLGIDVFDILENGYIHYHVRVSAGENATADDLIGIVNSEEGIEYHADAELKATGGTLVYQNIKG